MKILLLSLSAIALISAVAPAGAGKKNNTLNIAKTESIEGAGPIYTPSGENQLFNRVLFDTLINIDFENGKFIPALAKSWKQVDQKTWEFKLRKDVKFHDGSTFDADDVVYTINWTADPKVKFRTKNRFSWMKRGEKIDSHTVRIIAKKPYAIGMMRLATTGQIMPSDLHSSLERKASFGFKPVGTGAYRATSVDKNKGAVMVRVKHYPQTNKVRPIPSIPRIFVKNIPDEQTRVAEILAGNMDLARVENKDVANSLTANPRYHATAVNGLQYFYMYLDAADRTGIGILKDVRVRRALVHAIDLNTIRNEIVVGGKDGFDVNALCIPFQVGCGSESEKVPEYDPAKAKKLLAEAGYPNGFDIVLTTRSRERDVGQVIGGYLRKVGIRAKVNNASRVAYRKMQRGNKLQVLVGSYGSAGIPDVAAVLSFHFANKSRDYARDKSLNKLVRASMSTIDPAKRKKILGQALDLNNKQAYVVPLSPAPQVFVHSADVHLPTKTINGFGVVLHQLRWK